MDEVANDSFLRRHLKEILIGVLLLLVLALPFLLRGAIREPVPRDGERLVIMTPHNETIRWEFGDAFSRHMKEVHGKSVYIDWRNPGGTSEIAKVINSEFHAAFQYHWREEENDNWSEVEGAFNNRRMVMPVDGEQENEGQRARREFLASDVGIGMDLFFGGGSYDFYVQAGHGHIVAHDLTQTYGISPLMQEHPEWFSDEVIPAEVGGEPYRDSDNRWVGSCLSSFGMCFNVDSLERLGLKEHPKQWVDLGNSKLMGELALADPTKSGSATKAFEMLIQQQMAQAYEAEVFKASQAEQSRSDEDIEAAAVRQGWRAGMRLIQRISANARYFTDSSSKIPLDVAQGNAAAGMCIDFYGRTFVELTADENGDSRVEYLTPVGGSSTGVDPIAMFRGAPRPDLAHAFIKYVLSKEGQRLWNYRAGEPGGPAEISLRRLPIRRDCYTPEELSHFADPDVLPYETSDSFLYRPQWTGRAFNSIRFIIRTMCVDTHEELKHAWEALAEAGMPERALEVFEDLEVINYDVATQGIAETLSGDSKLQEVRLARDLTDHFRGQYRRAARLAKEHAKNNK